MLDTITQRSLSLQDTKLGVVSLNRFWVAVISRPFHFIFFINSSVK